MIRIALLLPLLLVPPVVGQAPSARLHGETEAAQTRKRLVEARRDPSRAGRHNRMVADRLPLFAAPANPKNDVSRPTLTEAEAGAGPFLV